MEYRPLADTSMQVSMVALGGWPITGLTSPGATHRDSLDTIRECFDLGINHLDTAYFYGKEGESERMIAEAVGERRDEMVIATKCGVHWQGDTRIFCGRPERLRQEVEESLVRLATDRIDLLYLHAPDPEVPVAESAGELRQLMEEGKTRAVGVSNVNLEQLQEFASACPTAAFQPAYNMLQRQVEADLLPYCREHGIAVFVYWALLKGFLAGRIGRDYVFPETDNRRKYPMFQGEERRKSHDLVDRLREIAAESNKTVAQLVVNWTAHQTGVTSVLCGAKRPEQIRETARASDWRLTADQLAEIDKALAVRGTPVTELPV